MATDYRQPQDVPGGSSVTTTALGFVRHVSWGALFAGVIVAVATQLTLTLLGIGIGVAAVSPAGGQSPATFAIGAGIWWLITGLISLFLGGWVAARMSGSVRRSEGALHGLGTWAAAAVFSALVMTTGMANFIGGSASLVNQYVSSNPQAQSQTAQKMERARESLGMEQPAQPVEPAQPIIGAQVQPQEVAQAADNVSKAAWWAFLGMVLGCGAAIGGGIVGAPEQQARVAAAEERRRAA